MAGSPSRLERLMKEARSLMDEDVSLEGWRHKLQRFIQFWIVVGKSFTQNRLPVRASSLAYVTLLALIPMLAVAMSVSSTFLKKTGEARIEQFIDKLVASVTPPDLLRTNVTLSATNLIVTVTNMDLKARTEADPDAYSKVESSAATGTNVVEISREAMGTNKTVTPTFLDETEAVKARQTVAKNINSFIQRTQSGTLGMTGSILLIFVAISMLSTIESTFNDIWGVVRGRSWVTRTFMYWGVISLVPMLLIVALGLATGPHLESSRKFISLSPFLSSLLFRILPVLVLSITFGVFYMLMPNTRVNWRAAAVGGMVAGLLFHLNNVFSVFYVSRVVTYSKIYGGLGLVLVFMMGLYLSWMILLFGAQVAYSFQNRSTYLEEKQCDEINQRGREFIALRLMTTICKQFQTAEPPPSVNQMAGQLCVPSRLIRHVLQTLVGARLLVEAAGTETGYMPGRPIETITCHDILEAMRATPGQELATRDEPARAEVFGEFARIQEAERAVASSVSMLALVNRAGPNVFLEKGEQNDHRCAPGG